MTSEVLIMNERGIALAADSASTVGSKTFIADRLHPLSDHRPVAVMAYGNGTIDGVPFENIVAGYRRRLGDRGYATLEEYADDFLAYIGDTVEGPIPQEYRDGFVYGCLHRMADRYGEESRDMLRRDGIGKDRAEEAVFGFFRQLEERAVSGADRNTVLIVQDEIESALLRAETRSGEPIRDFYLSEPTIRDALARALASAIVSNRSVDQDIGIVIAGYGDEEPLPSYIEFVVHGIFGNRVNSRIESSCMIGRYCQSAIVPFAQSDAIISFIGNMDPNTTDDVIERSLAFIKIRVSALKGKVITGKELEGFIDDATEYLASLLDNSYRTSKMTMEGNVLHLQPDEMARYAELLVTTAAYRQHLSDGLETIGTPVVTAVMTKHGGFRYANPKRSNNMRIDGNIEVK